MVAVFRPTRYVMAQDAAQVLDVLAGDPGARLLGGGTLVMARQDCLTTTLVDLTEAGLDGIAADRIGACATMGALARADLPGALVEAAALFGPPAIRDVATVGGNLVGGRTFGHAAPPLLALSARVHLDGPRGPRDLPLSELYGELGDARLAPGELLTEVTLPPPPTWSATEQVARYTLDHWVAVVSVAWTLDEQGRIARSCWAVGAAEAAPRVLEPVAEAVHGLSPGTRTLPEVAAAAARAALTPHTDHRASGAYRRHAVGVLVERLCRRGADA